MFANFLYQKSEGLTILTVNKWEDKVTMWQDFYQANAPQTPKILHTKL